MVTINTTELYVEYVVIGLENLCWVALLFYIVIGESFIEFMDYCINNIFSSVVLIGICYVLGLVMDRTSDKILECRKKRIKEKYKIKAKTSLLVWEKYGQVRFAQFTLSRIRILRSTIFNSAMISILGAYAVYKYYRNIVLMMLVVCVFGIVAIASNSAHRKLLENYYQKTSILDKEGAKGKKK